MSYIIHGATGAQGAPLQALLLASNRSAFAAVRDPANAQGKPYVTVDNDSVESLIAAYSNADGVFVHLPQTSEPGRLQQANNIADAIAAARPKRVVISTSGAIVDQPASPLQAPGDSAIATLLRRVGDSGVSHAVIAPRFYLENLLLPMVMGPVQSKGVLPYPLRADFSASWSSHLDVAVLAERLLTDHDATGIVGIGQLPGMTGPELAQAFSEHFGREIRFEALSPETFGTLLEPLIGPAAANIAGFYTALAHAPDNVIASDSSAQNQLGLAPRSVGQWLTDMGM
ncbi:hydroxylase [Sphingobium sp. Leaf26]|uniref:NmrA family NAD(P)-binding protein n=1 Tax=Sphingobium sp. Leaf26 TaxID=1735693 RepID=UPI0006FFC8F1|nr:NmrA family NAD(P)-binding protein [Sphingobium sp. Leaf26]KQN07142.1 hydroxylase [Sphingobium sp. Leaf26]